MFSENQDDDTMYEAIKSRKNGTATAEQIEILDKGHWSADEWK